MQRYSDVYMGLRNANDELWHTSQSISKKIELLNIFNMRQPYSLLMAAYKAFDINEFDRILTYIINIGFRYSVICGKNPNDIERIYNNIAVTISKSNIFNLNELKVIYVDDNEFVPLFNHKSFTDNTRNRKIVRYILDKYERFKGGQRDSSLTSETDTVEHILPQHPDEKWGENNYDFDSLIYRLGNLCLLEKKLNQNIENKSYSEKVDILKQSSFETTKSIPEEFREWNSESINRRQQQMGNAAKSIWKIDF